MHIWANLKSFLYDNDNFIAYFNNKIYLYNFINIITITNKEIVVQFKDHKVIIKGNNLKPSKVLKKELLLCGNIESVTINE